MSGNRLVRWWRRRRQVRRNRQDLLVLLALRELGETRVLYLSGVTGIPAPLARLEAGGLVQSRWETVTPAEVGKGRRRLYQMAGHADLVIPALAQQLRKEWT